jgi:hypothetical protein
MTIGRLAGRQGEVTGQHIPNKGLTKVLTFLDSKDTIYTIKNHDDLI